MSFKYKVNIWTKLNSFSTGHSQQFIVIQNRIQRFNPFRINITITNYPWSNIYFQTEKWNIKPNKNSSKISPLSILMLLIILSSWRFTVLWKQSSHALPSAAYFCFLITKIVKNVLRHLATIVTRSFSCLTLSTNNNTI